MCDCNYNNMYPVPDAYGCTDCRCDDLHGCYCFRVPCAYAPPPVLPPVVYDAAYKRCSRLPYAAYARLGPWVPAYPARRYYGRRY